MEQFTSTATAAAAIQDFLRTEEGRALPEDVQEKAWEMIRPGGSLAFATAHFAEMIFARKDVKSKAVMELAAACAEATRSTGVYPGGGHRLTDVAQVLKRRAGKKPPKDQKWTTAAEGPEPLEMFTGEDAKEADAEVVASQPLIAYGDEPQTE